MAEEWKNEDGKTFWEEQFGEESTVSKSLFVEKFEEELNRVDAMLKIPSFLSSIVDFTLASSPDAEEISREDLDYFLCRFGSMKTCIPRVCKSLFDSYGILYPWYHGKVDKHEAAAMAKREGDKSFLVRVSDTKLNLFAVTYMRPSGVQNSYIYTIPGGGYTMHKENWEANKKDYDYLTDVLADKKGAFAKEIPSNLHTDSSERMDKTEKNRNPYCLQKSMSQERVKAGGNYDVGGPSDEHKHGEHGGGSAYDALPGVNEAPGKLTKINTSKNVGRVPTSNYEVASSAVKPSRQPSTNNYESAAPERSKTVSRIKMTRVGSKEEAEPEDSGHSAYESVVRTGSVRNRKPVNRIGSNDVLQRNPSMLSEEELASASAYDMPAAKPPKPRRQESSEKVQEPSSAYESSVAVAASGSVRRVKLGGDKAPAEPSSNYETGNAAPAAPIRRMKLQRGRKEKEAAPVDED